MVKRVLLSFLKEKARVLLRAFKDPGQMRNLTQDSRVLNKESRTNVHLEMILKVYLCG